MKPADLIKIIREIPKANVVKGGLMVEIDGFEWATWMEQRNKALEAMPYETLHPGMKCCECGGRGKIQRHVPKYAIAMPGVANDWTYEDQTCWRCHGDGVARSLGVSRCSNL